MILYLAVVVAGCMESALGFAILLGAALLEFGVARQAIITDWHQYWPLPIVAVALILWLRVVRARRDPKIRDAVTRKWRVRHQLLTLGMTPAVLIYAHAWMFVSRPLFWQWLWLTIVLFLASALVLMNFEGTSDKIKHDRRKALAETCRYRPPFLSEDPAYHPATDERLDLFFPLLPVVERWADIRQAYRDKCGQGEGSKEALQQRKTQEMRVMLYKQLCAYHRGTNSNDGLGPILVNIEDMLADALVALEKETKCAIPRIPERAPSGVGKPSQAPPLLESHVPQA